MDCEFDAKCFLEDPTIFGKQAISLFHYQYKGNSLYREYVQLLRINPASVETPAQIPFLPIAFFKTHPVRTGAWKESAVFESSGTTGLIPSKHYIKEVSIYEESFKAAFERFYGKPEEWCIVGLLPSYLERSNSSLVYMTDNLIKASKHPDSGFYLNDFSELARLLEKNEAKGQKTWLIGVTFALMDFAQKFPLHLQHTVVLETGGMKGRSRELTRAEIQMFLQQQWRLNNVHAEYGMTELLSQAYSPGKGIFTCPPWMRVYVRDEDDPLMIKPSLENSVSGVINVIDLANIHSCAFIATEDIGKLYPDGSFEILGRMDNTDLRGCSMLVL